MWYVDSFIQVFGTSFSRDSIMISRILLNVHWLNLIISFRNQSLKKTKILKILWIQIHGLRSSLHTSLQSVAHMNFANSLTPTYDHTHWSSSIFVCLSPMVTFISFLVNYECPRWVMSDDYYEEWTIAEEKFCWRTFLTLLRTYDSPMSSSCGLWMIFPP
jgi:hypothetical protein